MILVIYAGDEKTVHGTTYKNCGDHTIHLELNDKHSPVKYESVTEQTKSGNPMASQQSWKQKHKR